MVGRTAFLLALVGCASNDPPVNWGAAPPPPFGYGGVTAMTAPPPPPPFGYVAVESAPAVTISAGVTISTESRTCLMGAYGHQACGYDCVLSNGAAFCATQPGGSCVVDAWGNAYCR